jgi:thiazole synthase
MAGAFASAIRAGHQAHQAGLMERRDMAAASTPVFGMAQFS